MIGSRALAALGAAAAVTVACGTALAQQSVVAPGATSTPPPPGPPRSVRYPLPVATTLPNGLRVVAVRIPGSVLVAADLVVPGGSLADPEAAPGVASLTASLLTRGTAHHSAREIGVDEDGLGATLQGSASSDRSEVMTDAVAARFPAALALLAEVVREPAFAADEIALAKQRATNAVTLQLGTPSALATLVAQRALFRNAFGRPGSGTAGTIATIDRDAIVAYHRTYYRPAGAVLTVGGDLSAGDAFALARSAFEGWTAPAEAVPPAPSPAPAAPRLVVVDQPAAGRTAIAVAHVAPVRGAANYAVASACNALLSGYSGRLNEEIRIKRGLSYGASSTFVSGRYAGTYVASTLVEHAKVPEALDVMLTTIASLGGAAPPSTDELSARRTSLLGGQASMVESTTGLVRVVAGNAFYGLPLDELEALTTQLNAVDAASIARFAKDALATPPTIVLVGDASKFVDAVRKAHPDLTLVKAADLDLTSASLTH